MGGEDSLDVSLRHHLKLPVRVFGDAGLEFTEDIE